MQREPYFHHTMLVLFLMYLTGLLLLTVTKSNPTFYKRASNRYDRHHKLPYYRTDLYHRTKNTL
jgi:hypothetical protein